MEALILGALTLLGGGIAATSSDDNKPRSSSPSETWEETQHQKSPTGNYGTTNQWGNCDHSQR